MGLLLGLLAFVASNLGMGLQKAGTTRGSVPVWLLGTGLTVSGSLLLFPALALGRASVIAPLEGVGLAALALFAWRVLGERPPVTALVAIAAGTALVGAFGGGDRQPDEVLRPERFGQVALAVVAAAALLALVPRRGVGLGLAAGAMAGLAMLFQKALGEVLLADPVAVLGDARALGFLAAAGAGFLGLQWSYRHGRAVEVVPSYAAGTILVPTAAAPFLFGEAPHLAAWAGVALILLGIVLLKSPPGSD